MTDPNLFGPIEYLVVEFPDGKIDPEGFEQVLALVDSRTIRILDLEFVVKYADGHATVFDADELNIDSFDVTAFAGASSHLLDTGDLATIAGDISVGSIAAVLVYEELALLPAIESWTRQGGRIIAEGHLDLDEFAEALTSTAPQQENQE
ncbi:DUF6325 family protein [Rhodococcus erythropolis]|uniref:DUF6325 family protein n=1 Tax=Rhodococcus erythropolis TaxID=1833 RepID=UPI0033B29712